eukprot:UN32466
MRMGLKYDTDTYQKPDIPKEEEIDPSEMEHLEKFKKLHLLKEEPYLINLIHENRQYNIENQCYNDLLLNAEVQRKISLSYPKLSGLLLNFLRQMRLIETVEKDTRFYLRLKFDEGRIFTISRTASHLLMGLQNFEWIENFCGIKIQALQDNKGNEHDVRLYYLSGTMEQRCEALALLVESPFKHNHERLTAKDVLSWFSFSINTLILLTENSMWSRAERTRSAIFQILSTPKLPLTSIKNSEAMARLTSLYQSQNMNKDWLFLDWLKINNWSPNLYFFAACFGTE